MKLFRKTPAWETREPPSRLVHIGPHKTGTTAVQLAFHNNRESLAEHGVHYVGDRLQPTQAAKAITGHIPQVGLEPGLAEWRELMTAARESGARCVVLSSEFLCQADSQAAARVVDDLGGDDTRIVVTLRPLAKILPSQWQQFVQAGETQPFEAWIDHQLARFDTEEGLFWTRHRHDRLVERWAAVVGTEQVTVVVAESSDPDDLPRIFARLSGLPDDLLTAASSVTNRSLTWQEVEAIRHFNIQFEKVNKRRRENDQPLVPLSMDQRMAAWRHVKRRTPLPLEDKIVLPEATLSRVGALATRITTAIERSGVEVIGDLKVLTRTPDRKDVQDSGQPSMVPVQVAARVANGVLMQTAPSGAVTAPVDG